MKNKKEVHMLVSESDKNRIVILFNEGASTAEVLKKFKLKYSKMQLAAIKAHITIGSYKKEKSQQEDLSGKSVLWPVHGIMITKINDSDKKHIIKYIKEGLDTFEIMEKMGKYTRQQIAAVRAWLTMGNYKGGLSI